MSNPLHRDSRGVHRPHTTTSLRIDARYDGIDRITLQVHGNIDLANLDVLRGALEAAVAEGAQQLIVDLRATRYCSGAGINCLADAAQAAESLNCHLYTISSQTAVVRPIELLGFTEVLRLRDDPAKVPSPFLEQARRHRR
jgi:anti-sigma B factor antagonist